MKTLRDKCIEHVRERCGLNAEMHTTARSNFGTVSVINPVVKMNKPVHLEHLLRAISLTGGRRGVISIPTPDSEKYDIEQYFVDTMVAKILCIYDLTKSVEQNLTESPELCGMVAGLLGLKDTDERGIIS